MAIWKREFDLNQLNHTRKQTLVETLGIMITDFGDDYLTASMPVESRTHQPMGILHGGASVVLAETVGSIAANMAVDDKHYCVGMEINANHLRPVKSGLVYATCHPIHIGNSTQVWDIRISDERQRPVCISRLTMAVLVKKKGKSK
ncbi:MAG: hotdog fold thioesterase [Kangiellaceae bacterium]|nr:hotdog fold thioesterase [Kangiellaceae bacterium]